MFGQSLAFICATSCPHEEFAREFCPGEKIGDDEIVSILAIKGNQVRVGIDAPPATTILRDELTAHKATPKVGVRSMPIGIGLIVASVLFPGYQGMSHGRQVAQVRHDPDR